MGDATSAERIDAIAEARMKARPYPDLLSKDERKAMLADAEELWRRLVADDLGGYSGINRPFYILHAFKEVIEKYGHRDVGLTWSQNDLEATTKE